MRVISEAEFKVAIVEALADPYYDAVGYVTGPGRSGAVAAVYASHILGVPFIPYGSQGFDPALGRLLIIDTATWTGKTGRKAMKKYEAYSPISLAIFNEKAIGIVQFWYEAVRPQRYRHEKVAA